MNHWYVNEDTFDPKLKTLHSQETVYTIGNGYFCTRGTFEEGYPRDNSATLLFGVFDDIAIAKEELANAPDWTSIQLFINRERFRLDRGKILSYHRHLDLQHGLLYRQVDWESPQGIRVRITSERFACLSDEHVGAIRYSVTCDESAKEAIDIALWASFNVAEGNYDVMHWEPVDQGHQNSLLWLQTETKRSGIQLAQTMSFQANIADLQVEMVDSDIAPSIRLSGELAPGTTCTTEKIVVMYTSRDSSNPLREALTHHQNLITEPILQEPDIHNALSIHAHASQTEQSTADAMQPYDTLKATHIAAWHSFWQIADVLIEGDSKAQLGIRYNIYQLRINTSAHDSRYSIAAKGLTGFGYRGHVFHDTEIFMLPFFTYVLPHIARNLLLYRYHLLPAARKKAASNGYEGAQYPWESTLNGEETTPPSIIHPETGEVIPVLNGFIELHITASIAHAVCQYWHITGDDDFMRNYGTEILLSTAQFWTSRAEKNPERHDYEINNVIGPDEWHEHVNNNVYTNYMAKWNIQQAINSLHWLHTYDAEKAQELLLQLHITEQDLESWQDVVEHLRILQDPKTKVFEQFENFFNLEPLDQKKYAGRRDSFQGILGIDAIQKYRIIKQADVLMLLTVLDEQFDQETKEANWDYYFPITDHDYGSSLTPALHAILACELGHTDEAYNLLMKGALVDLENLRGNTPEGIHAACAGAVWQAVVLGFAGLRVTDEGHTTTPHWPDGWKRLAFTIHHKGQPVHIDLHR
ncbi:glycoside hydrolase family 65 protein [Ktedonosporobacter rubrisoli]|uniref:Glycoside hydrolase family 65 protein n=1 Tax=Ktedonosporobacter rubrisoli TaxID=2509675 RepID=A0A4P6JRR0_KTERU|nr:glycoside hydrolase family 65 protein [Ktedonosporobacter rubrisoli]QBD77985.1 glycoside hydrolase family 65 protein [Ktedonosporobacter rubrisoli]